MKRIFVIGDSISIQYGPYLKQYLRGIADYARKEGEDEARLNLDRPVGANGGDSSMVLAYLRGLQAAGGLKADLLLLNCGLHDIKTNPVSGAKQVPLADYARNLRAIVDLVKALGPALVWIRTTPCDDGVHNKPGREFYRFAADVAAYNAAADRVMQETGVASIDLHGFTLALGPDLYCDHVHFHEPIRQLQGAFLAGWVARWVR